jgi:hypothetical protein
MGPDLAVGVVRDDVEMVAEDLCARGDLGVVRAAPEVAASGHPQEVDTPFAVMDGGASTQLLVNHCRPVCMWRRQDRVRRAPSPGAVP